MTNAKIFFLVTFARTTNVNICFFSLLLSQGEKKSCFFLLFSSLLQGEEQFEENCYINIHELININISSDGHPITFV